MPGILDLQSLGLTATGDFFFPSIALGWGGKDFRILRKVGLNPDVDTGATLPEDVWGGGGVYTGFAATAQRISVASASANDTALGTGARRVRIAGLDANWNEISEEVALSGTTPVLTADSFLRFTRAQVVESGNGNMSLNAGDITFRQQTTTTNILEVMRAGYSQTFCGAFSVPAGWTGLLRNLAYALDRQAAGVLSGELWYREFGAAPRMIRPFFPSQAYMFHDDLLGGVPLPPKTDIVPRVRSCSANNSPILVTYEVVLVRN